MRLRQPFVAGAPGENNSACIGITNRWDIVSILMYPGVLARRISSSMPANATCTFERDFVSSWLERWPTKKFSDCASSSLLIVDGDCVEYTIPTWNFAPSFAN